jgi:hypothetical protein
MTAAADKILTAAAEVKNIQLSRPSSAHQLRHYRGIAFQKSIKRLKPCDLEEHDGYRRA